MDSPSRLSQFLVLVVVVVDSEELSGLAEIILMTS
jgi:hypothetical protein